MDKHDFTTLVLCDTARYRGILNNMTVKKTITIPQWLSEPAVAVGNNFSRLLQKALKVEQGVI